MCTCLLCGGTESGQPLFFSHETKSAFEKQFPGIDLEVHLAGRGICAECLGLPHEIRDHLMRAANRVVLDGLKPSRMAH